MTVRETRQLRRHLCDTAGLAWTGVVAGLEKGAIIR
jgi:hypothetical protein